MKYAREALLGRHLADDRALAALGCRPCPAQARRWICRHRPCPVTITRRLSKRSRNPSILSRQAALRPASRGGNLPARANSRERMGLFSRGSKDDRREVTRDDKGAELAELGERRTRADPGACREEVEPVNEERPPGARAGRGRAALGRRGRRAARGPMLLPSPEAPEKADEPAPDPGGSGREAEQPTEGLSEEPAGDDLDAEARISFEDALSPRRGATSAGSPTPAVEQNGGRDRQGDLLREPEGRRREDHVDAEPRGRVRRVGPPRALHRPGPAGQPDDEPGHRPRQGREVDVRRARAPHPAHGGDPGARDRHRRRLDRPGRRRDRDVHPDRPRALAREGDPAVSRRTTTSSASTRRRAWVFLP